MRTRLHQLRVVLDRRTKRGFIYATLGSAVISTFDMLAIALILPMVDLATGAGSGGVAARYVAAALKTTDRRSMTVALATLVVALFIAKDLLSIGFTWWMAGFKAFNRVRTASTLLRHFLNAPYAEISSRSSADLMRTLGDGVIQVYGSVAFGLMNILTGTIAITAIGAALLASAPVPTLALIAYLGVSSLIYVRAMKPRTRRAGESSAQAAADAWRSALTALGARKESKLRSSEEFFVERYRKAALRGAEAGRHAEFIGGLPRYILEMLFIVAIGVTLVVNSAVDGSPKTAGGVGMLALFVAAGFRILPTITSLISAFSNVRFGLPYLELVYAEMNSIRELPRVPNVSGPSPISREIRLEGVGFTYPGADRKVLEDISLVIPRGSSVAFVGGSGAGKTTLIDILLGLHPPQVGEVLVDGRNVWDDIQGWRMNLGYVPQDVFLFEGSLAENIAFDRDVSEIDQRLLQHCIERAQLGDLVAGLPQGVHTHLGERGARLSGGERQRVGIARALYRDPKVLLLDEATSALDNETENRISGAVQALRGTITVIIVAHRLSTVKHADRLFLLSEGRVAASGTFQELRDQSPEFDRLVRLGSLDLTE